MVEVAAAVSLTFKDLWDNYPHNEPCINPRTGKKAYDDQCAVRLGVALEKSGVDFTRFHGARCEFGPRGNGMALRAEELAVWLRTRPFLGCPTPLVVPGKQFQQQFKGRTGIMFFKDYWLRAGEKFPTGDHIDLWNRDRLTPSFYNFMRFSLGISRLPNFNPFRTSNNPNWYSNLAESKQVFFWPIL